MQSDKTKKFFRAELAIVACLACGLILLLTNSATVPQTPDQFAEVRSKIEARVAEEHIPSLAVAIGRNGKIIWAQGFGWSDRENRVAATEHTMYPIGSVSKPITATGLMLLVERGAVDLDQPVNKYLGALRLQAHVGDDSKATVRRVANHTSGLARYSRKFYADESTERPSIHESIRRYGHLLWEPGETYEYSNLGYGILAHLIERQSGTSFAEFMRQNVFLPLGMTHTSVELDKGLQKHYAVAYGRDQSRIPFFWSGYPGASDIHSSAYDLVRFGMFHLKHLQVDRKNVLTDRSIQLMQEPTAKRGEHLYYGIGWNIEQDYYGLRRVYHTGHTGHSTASLMLLPDENICVVALSNSSTDLVVRASKWILAALLPKYAERLKQQESRSDDEGVESYRPSEEWLGHWEGSIQTYARNIGVEMWFEKSGDIYLQMQGQPKTFVSGARMDNGYIRGSINGDIGTDDANRHPYNLHIKLKRRGNVLNGSITATSLPGRRVGSVLSYWMELKKVN